MQPPASCPSDKIEKSLTNEGAAGHAMELCDSCTCPKHGAQAHLAASGHFRNVGSPLATLECKEGVMTMLYLMLFVIVGAGGLVYVRKRRSRMLREKTAALQAQ
jgi:hypothetical protein